jgi:hypothetical protein
VIGLARARSLHACYTPRLHNPIILSALSAMPNDQGEDFSKSLLGKNSLHISESRMCLLGAWDKTHGRGCVYVHTVACKRDGEVVRMYKIGRSKNPDRRLGEWQRSCPHHRHQLVSVVDVRYQVQTGESILFISFRVY